MTAPPSTSTEESVANRFVMTFLVEATYDSELFVSRAQAWRNTDDSVVPPCERVHARGGSTTVAGIETFSWRTGFAVEFAYVVADGDARTLRIPACIVGHLDGDRICRIQEYLDSATVCALERPHDGGSGRPV